jgi:hypothetical protein
LVVLAQLTEEDSGFCIRVLAARRSKIPLADPLEVFSAATISAVTERVGRRSQAFLYDSANEKILGV